MPDIKMVFRQSDNQFNDVAGMGIFDNGGHVGFIFKEEKSGNFHRLHLDFKGLRDGELKSSPPWLWTPSALDLDNKNYLRAYLNTINKQLIKSPELRDTPYAIRHLTFCFTPSGEYVPIPEGYGFTCVTFMLRLLVSNSYFDIDWDTWPSDRLSENRDLMEEYNNYRKRLGEEPRAFVENSRRIRPEEGVVIFFKARKNSKITFQMIEPDSILANNQINALLK